MNRPWYYVPGRKDLTERRLVRKRELDNRKEETWNQINKYFLNWNTQSKIFNDWSKIRPQEHIFTLPPYDGSFIARTESVEISKLHQSETILRNIIKEISVLETDSNKVKVTGNAIFAQITLLKCLMNDASGQISSWIIKAKKLHFVRFARDKLRHQVFLSLQKLNYFHHVLQSVYTPSSNDSILTKHESEELMSVITSGLNILTVFIELNRRRNFEIVNMFHEEAISCLSDFQQDWSNEDTICWQLVCKIFDALEVIFKEKLEHNIQVQESFLEKRKEKFEQLAALVTSMKQDELLWKTVNARIQAID